MPGPSRTSHGSSFSLVRSSGWATCSESMIDQATTRAVVLAGAERVVPTIEQGMETQLGQTFGGVDLSGGRWQKLLTGVVRGSARGVGTETNHGQRLGSTSQNVRTCQGQGTGGSRPGLVGAEEHVCGELGVAVNAIVLVGDGFDAHGVGDKFVP